MSPIKEAIEARALKLADSRLEDERGTYEWSLDAEITLRECAAALAALRSMPAEPEPEPTLKWCSACGEGVTTFCRAPKRAISNAGCPMFATPPTAPVLSDAEILDWLEANVKETPLNPGAYDHEDPARRLRYEFPTLVSYDCIGQQISLRDAIRAAIGRASRGAK